jgi:hypothetical protein
MTCRLTGARQLNVVLEALLIAVTLAKHLKFNGFKNFEGLGLEPHTGAEDITPDLAPLLCS